MATLTDIARHAGVSPSVVSRVVNGDATLRISAETRARVVGAVEALDYAPNWAARSLRSATSGTIALLVHDVSNPVYSEIVRGVQDAAARAGRSILLGEASASRSEASRLASVVAGGGTDGLVLQGDGGVADRLLARAARRKVPIVLLQAALDIEAHLVRLPDRAATRMACEHLAALGHRRIGCVATTEGLSFTQERVAGWRDVLPETSDDWLVHGAPSIEAGREGALRLFSRAPDLTALVCCNVMSAIGALEAARERNLDVPGNLSIVAIHDIELAGYLRVPLTTVAMPLFDLGTRAVEIVIGGASGSAGRGETVIESAPRLIERGSTTEPNR